MVVVVTVVQLVKAADRAAVPANSVAALRLTLASSARLFRPVCTLRPMLRRWILRLRSCRSLSASTA
jgi:hypothetical protein